MRNPDLSKLLKSIAEVAPPQHKIIYEQSAIELEKLEQIYKWVEQNKDSDMGLLDVAEILKD